MSRPCKPEETGSRLAEQRQLFYMDKLPHSIDQSGRKGEDAAKWQSAS